MGRKCEICGKTPITGHNISHAHNVSKRRFNPNLQRIKIKIGNKTKKAWVCTRCLKSNKVIKT
jgi:large subunit ribosomal protein L28